MRTLASIRMRHQGAEHPVVATRSVKATALSIGSSFHKRGQRDSLGCNCTIVIQGERCPNPDRAVDMGLQVQGSYDRSKRNEF
jgi:hypothetical protein